MATLDDKNHGAGRANRPCLATVYLEPSGVTTVLPALVTELINAAMLRLNPKAQALTAVTGGAVLGDHGQPARRRDHTVALHARQTNLADCHSLPPPQAGT